MESEDGVFGIDPDLFYKEAFDAIEDQINSEEGAGDLQSFAEGPEDKKEAEADDGLIKGGWEDRNGQLTAVLTVAAGYPGAFSYDIMWIRVGKQPIGQKGGCFYVEVRNIVQAAELGQVYLFVLFDDAGKDLRAGKGRFAVGGGIISAVENAPIPVSGDLAANTSHSIGQHKGGGGGVVEMPEGDAVLFCIIPDSQCGADKSSIKGEPAEGEEGFDGVAYKIVPGFQAVKDFGSGKAEDGGEDGHVPYPVMGPDPYFPLFGGWKPLFILFPPFQPQKEQTYDDTSGPAALGGHDKVLGVGGEGAIGNE